MSEPRIPDDWTAEQKSAFLRLLRLVSQNQDMFTHPKAAPIPAEHWDTIAWNVVYMVVEPVADDELLCLEQTDGVKFIEKTSLLQ